MANFPIMKENQISLSSRISVYLMLGVLYGIAFLNLCHDKVVQPNGFLL